MEFYLLIDFVNINYIFLLLKIYSIFKSECIPSSFFFIPLDLAPFYPFLVNRILMDLRQTAFDISSKCDQVSPSSFVHLGTQIIFPTEPEVV